MNTSFYRDLDISDLGDYVTESDLADFVSACKIYQLANPGTSEADAMAFMFGEDGNWPTRIDETRHNAVR
jgi:hypothetical protein